MRGELETGTDCYILTQSSSDHSSTSSPFWLGCSTVGHWGPKPSVWGWLSLRWHPIWNWNWPKPSVAPGHIIVWRPPASCGRMHLPPSPNSTTSTGQGDIPISSTRCTCFAVLPLNYTGASLVWRLGRGSICYTKKKELKVHVRHAMLCEFKNNKNATETAKKISSFHGQSLITNNQVRSWFSKFRSSDMPLRNQPRSRRSSDFNQHALRKLVECYSRKNTWELALDFNTSQSTIYRHLK